MDTAAYVDSLDVVQIVRYGIIAWRNQLLVRTATPCAPRHAYTSATARCTRTRPCT